MRRAGLAVLGAALLGGGLLLWGRYGLAVVLADPGWFCLPG